MLKKLSAELLLFFLTFSLRLSYIFIFFAPAKYLRFLPAQSNLRAIDLLNGKPVFFPDAWSSYYLIVALFYKFFKFIGLYEKKEMAIVTLNVFLGSLAVCFFYRLAKKIVSSRVAFIASLIMAVYYPLLYLNSLNLSENVFVFTLIASLYFLVTSKTFFANVLSGLLLGISIICRPLLFSFFPFLLIWILSDSEKLSKRTLRFLTIATFALFIILGSSLLNFKVGRQKYFSLATNGGVNFALAQCEFKKLSYKYKNETFYFTPPALWQSKNRQVATNVPFYNQLYYYRMGLECLKKNPEQLLQNTLHIKNLFSSLFYPSFANIPNHQINLLFWKIVSLIFLLLFIAYPYLENNRQKSRLYELFLGLIFSLFLSVYFLNMGEERYLAPYFFALNLFAVAAICKLLDRKNFSRLAYFRRS